MNFDDTETEEYKFHQYKSPILINDIDINKIVVSNKLPFGKQGLTYFIDYKEWVYIKDFFHKTKFMYFMIKDEQFFDEYMKIWEKVSNAIKKK